MHICETNKMMLILNLVNLRNISLHDRFNTSSCTFCNLISININLYRFRHF